MSAGARSFDISTRRRKLGRCRRRRPLNPMSKPSAYELRDAVRAAGFEVETLITEPIEKFSEHLPVWNFLEENGFNTAYRGEQTYCVAVKRAALPINRFPAFLYYDAG